MSNLVQELGIDYFNSRFTGSFFKHNDATHIVQHSFRGQDGNFGVRANLIEGTVAKPKIQEVDLSADFFVDMGVFAAPNLGWRSANSGRYLAYFQRTNRSYRRGVSAENISSTLSPLTAWLVDNNGLSLSYYRRDTVVAKMVMEPEYYPLHEGLKLINEGKVVSFCISENLAVFPESEDMLALMFNQSKVGTISMAGEINCSIPVLGEST